MNSSGRKGPVSVEDLVRLKQEQDAKNARPKFLSKQERAAAALARRAQQVEDERGEGRAAVRRGNEPNNADSPVTGRNGAENPMEQSSDDAEVARKEAELLKRRFLGIPDTEKKRRRLGENRKFTFDWDNKDDTSESLNPVYAQRHEYHGRLGGYDEREAEARRLQAHLHVLNKDETEHPEQVAEREERMRKLVEADRRRAKRTNWDDVPWREKPIEAMKDRDWRILREDYQISSKGGRIPNPLRNWEESGLPRKLLRIIDEVGYKEPSAIQRATIPIGMINRDLIGIAETGSGKTAAFILPMLCYISQMPPLTAITKNDGPYAIVLAPTRELAQQIEGEANKFAKPLGFRAVSIVGGHALEEQALSLADGAHIVIATPGRLLDCLERHLLVLNQCNYVVMDEADRMVDMGFEDSVNKILSALPDETSKPDTEAAEDVNEMTKSLSGKQKYRQTTMFSATFLPSVEKIARNYLRRPAIVTIGNPGQAVDRVEQRVEMMKDQDETKRLRRLEEILESRKYNPPIIIFVNTKRNCDFISKHLAKLGWNSVILHGGKSQDQRELALGKLRSGEADCLVATDLAGRGIDVADVSLVLNYNMAKTIEDYTHRIGRTGRAGKSGVAITFLGPEDQDVYYDLRQMIQKSSISKVPDELRRHEASQQKPSSIKREFKK